MSSSFADLGVSEPVVRLLATRGVTSPFPIQEMVMRDALAGADVWAKSPTGSGKTLGFGLPIIERVRSSWRGPCALVLVPTRELAVQVADELTAPAKARDLRVAVAYGGVGLGPQAKLASRCHILIATPGRLTDLMERSMVSLSRVSILVLDEADRMLDMGFVPQVRRIVRSVPERRQTLMFSATLDGEVARLAAEFSKDPVVCEVAAPKPTVELIDHHFIAVSAEDKIGRLVQTLDGERGLALVFVRTKHGADRLAKRLTREGVSAVAMHGDLSQGQRERALARFSGGQTDILVATDVAARGLDVEHITHVVNFDPPSDDKTYVHRVGRTARAGRSGTGITFVQPEQRGDVARMAQRLLLHDDFARSGMVAARTSPSGPGGRSRGRGNAGRRYGKRR